MADVEHEKVSIPEDDGYTMRKRMAMGKSLPTGDFGVADIGSQCAGGSDTRDAHLGDHERAAGKPIGGNQANPNHGFKR